jgi:hypothetical protein
MPQPPPTVPARRARSLPLLQGTNGPPPPAQAEEEEPRDRSTCTSRWSPRPSRQQPSSSAAVQPPSAAEGHGRFWASLLAGLAVLAALLYLLFVLHTYIQQCYYRRCKANLFAVLVHRDRGVCLVMRTFLDAVEGAGLKVSLLACARAVAEHTNFLHGLATLFG